MKSNFFKIVLPAFALMLAITASLAFTSANNDVAEDTTIEITTAFYKNGLGNPCVLVNPVSCQVEFVEDKPCTISLQGVDRQLFMTETQTSCTVLLYEWEGPQE
ncbi:DUF6520 family protein [Flavivirga abyssicola]|uniref:DUF6520 family protein n=1 Tax=Flavivirga abyssicola TaxID=3063533 RepID=UPI002ED060BD|nr:DUF6520 family protein [Flavivirga sp. MEBiC07777]